MTQTSKALQKNPTLEPGQDFYRLRREGIGFIAQMGSRAWTDYNVHDPGITILEALCYAITDLTSRLGWDIADILTPQGGAADPPYPNQAFFTAREILTVNPVTPDDFRRLLIDLDRVRNAWMLCKECACEASYLAWCDKDTLTLSYAKPDDRSIVTVDVSPHGLYEALLELESDPELGDLNDRKIESRYVTHDPAGAHTTLVELRFPDISLSAADDWASFLGSDPDWDAGTFTLAASLGTAGIPDVFAVPAAAGDQAIRDNWRSAFSASFSITLPQSARTIEIKNAVLRLFGDGAARDLATADDLKKRLGSVAADGFIQRYRNKARQARAAAQSATAALQHHRNLDEDYCLVSTAGVEEVAVCADVEVRADADIERVQAEIWFRIEQYFNPPILFRTLQELRAAGEAVEEIFDGPALESGFITADDLKHASLRTVLRVSDILNSLMDIDGVTAVNQLLLTKYDAGGDAVRGAADPTWDADGQPIFDQSKVSAAWLLFITSRHLPRLYLNRSRFLFLKNGLPFRPRMDEATDALNQLRGDAARPKNPKADKDIAIRKGEFRDPNDYYPVQYSFPLTYGIGPSGLPSNASPERQALAKQLKAYLMVFEQLLANALAQLAHTADLFSLDPSIARTTFVTVFSEAVIKGFGQIAPGMTLPDVEKIAETGPEFYERRNRFLNHLLARFGEDFSEYALLLTDVAGKAVAQQRLIDDKIAFLKRYAEMSRDRGRAFDHTQAPCAEENYPEIKKRISLLLGQPDLSFVWTVGTPFGAAYPLAFRLVDGHGAEWLRGSLTVAAASGAEATRAAYRLVVAQMVRDDAYRIVNDTGLFRLMLSDAASAPLGEFPRLFARTADAAAMRDGLMAWSANERLIVVEHLLLRPKFPGDALYPVCCEGGCTTCGDEDPYSFRLTFVMPGWVPQYVSNLDLRRFADRTIQQETPSHLLPKICWVGNDGFVENLCDDVIGDLASLLMDQGLTTANVPPTWEEACACATLIYQAFSKVFAAWYEDKLLDFIHADALFVLVGAEFAAKVQASAVSCTTMLPQPLWTAVQDIMTKHFAGLAATGWQFERFESAWCKWLEADAAIDWTEEHLIARVQALLQRDLSSPATTDAICACAKTIVTNYGTHFFEWMRVNVMAGRPLEAFTKFVPPAVTRCAGINGLPGTLAAVQELLNRRYASYVHVSYRLWVVVLLLGELRNTYPGATLHDCDDGSDHNPVRLNSTALGNYPLRTTLT